jgi:hypothetical protein
MWTEQRRLRYNASSAEPAFGFLAGSAPHRGDHLPIRGWLFVFDPEEESPLKLGVKRPGTSTIFLDSSSNEALLELTWGADGAPLLAFRLYDCEGRLVAESSEAAPITRAVFVAAKDGEVLLDVPADPEMHIRYRLRNRLGQLVTCSDGERTQIYGYLKMDAKKAK